MPDMREDVYRSMEELRSRGELDEVREAKFVAEQEKRSGLTKSKLVNHALKLDAEAMTIEDAAAFSNLWASKMDYSSTALADLPEHHVALTGEQYFQQHKEPHERIKYIQHMYNPEKHKEMQSEYSKFNELDREGKLTQDGLQIRAVADGGDLVGTAGDARCAPADAAGMCG